MRLEVAAKETRLPTPLKRLGVEVKEKLGFLGAIEGEEEDIMAARDMALNWSLAFSIQLFSELRRWWVLGGAPGI